MKSPKFQNRSKELSSIFHPTDIKQTWKNKVRYALRSSPLPDPVEYLDYNLNIEAVSRSIHGTIINGSYHPGPNIRLLLEKSKGLCRQLVLTNPIDAIILQRLSDRIWPEIKSSAPSSQAFFEPDDHKFSKSMKELFADPSYGGFRAWLAFQKALFGFAKVRNYIVATDIANYYDFVNYNHLRNILSSYISEKNETILDTLIYSLSGMLWQPDYMPRVEMGLPQMPLTAPRLLAHCFLYETDDFLKNRKGIDFVRFMDDIDVGVDTYSEAKKIARDLDLVLHTRQVRLNSGKTRILTKHQAVEHFKIRENYFLDVIQDHINWKLNSGLDLGRERRVLKKWLVKQYRRGDFDAGNGEKILKRLITTIRKIGGVVPAYIQEDCLRNRPSVRATIIEYIKYNGIKPAQLKMIESYLEEDVVIDDSVPLLISGLYVEASCKSPKKFKYSAEIIVEYLVRYSNIGLFSAIWIASRFFDSIALSKLVSSTVDRWQDNPTLLRLIGALSPLLTERTYLLVETVITRSSFQEARSVFDFQSKMRNDKNAYSAIKNQILAENPSKPLRITHSKFIILLYIFLNSSIKNSVKIHIAKIHKIPLQSYFYKKTLLQNIADARLRKRISAILK